MNTFDISALEAQTREMNKAIEDLRTQYREKIKVSFHEATKSFFVATPDVRALEWTQYSPHWNDGEECTFYVHDVWYYLSFQDPDSEEEEWDNGESAGFGYSNGKSEAASLEKIEQLKSVIALADAGTLTTEILEKHPKKYDVADGKYTTSGFGSDYRSKYVYTFNKQKALESLREEEAELESIRINAPIYARKDEIVKNVEAIRSFISKIDDSAMEDMFGNHVRVRVTAEGVEVNDHDHD